MVCSMFVYVRCVFTFAVGPGRAKDQQREMSDDLLLMAFLRNFGGLPPDVPSLVS